MKEALNQNSRLKDLINVTTLRSIKRFERAADRFVEIVSKNKHALGFDRIFDQALKKAISKFDNVEEMAATFDTLQNLKKLITGESVE